MFAHDPLDGHGQKGVVDPHLLRRAVLVSALCLKRLDGMKIEVRSGETRNITKGSGRVYQMAYDTAVQSMDI